MAALGLSACGLKIAVPTDPDNYAIEPTAAAHLRAPQSVALRNGFTEEAKAEFPLQHNFLVVEQRQLTETAIVMLGRALEKRGIATSPQAEKSVTLRVRARGYRFQLFRYTGRVLLEAQLGDGTVINLPNECLSPRGYDNAFDGAVLLALNDLLGADGFTAYLNR